MMVNSCGEMIKCDYQKGISYALYDTFKKFESKGGVQVLVFLFTWSIIQCALSLTPASADFFGMKDDGSLEEATFDGKTSTLVTKLKKTWTLVQSIGSFIVGLGIIATAMKYRSEDNPDRAREFLIRGFTALIIVNIVVYVINFFSGTYGPSSN